MIKWYENIVRIYNILLIMIDILFLNIVDILEEKVDYLIG